MYDIGLSAGMPTGSVHPILMRMLEAEWLVDDWEDSDSSPKDRPRRRYMYVTEHGRRHMRTLLRGGTRRR